MKFFLADECPLTRSGMRNFLSSSALVEVVGEAGSVGETIRLVAESRPDFVVMDPEFRAENNSGEDDGHLSVGVCRSLKSLPGPPRVIVYTAHDSIARVAAVMLAGADGYVHKSTPYEELVETRERIRRGEKVWMPGPRSSEARLMNEVFSGKVRLTPREQQVLELLFQRYTNEEMANKLHVSLQTAKNHVGVIFRKLGVGSRKELRFLLGN